MNLGIDPQKKSGDLRELARRARRMAAALSQAADRRKPEGWRVKDGDVAMAKFVNSLDIRKEPERKAVNVGDLVQWIDGSDDKFETPRRVRAIQTYKGQEWAFVEGSATRIPLSKLSIVAPASGATVAPPTTALPDPVVMGPTSEGRDWLPGRWSGPEKHISSRPLSPLTLAFVLGAVAFAAGIYLLQGMNPWRPPPPSAIAGMPPQSPQSAPAAALPPSSPVVAPRAPANLSPKEAEAAASIAPKAATPMPDQASLSPSEIAEIQARLESLGMNPGPWDGVWGPQTATAIRRYKKSKGQPQIGNVSRELLERLRREAPAIQAPPVEATPVVPNAPVPLMERPDQYELNTSEIWEVQDRLEFLGMQPGSPDGIPGYRTFNAIRRYEESRGQAETGKLDRELLERLRWEPN